MILSEALQSVTRTLRRAEIPDASVEAEVLLGHVLGMSRTCLYTEPDRSLTSGERECLRRVVRRRLDREPAAYILGHWEFYGIDLCVEPHTLIPRPETELLVEEAIKLAGHISRQGEQTTIADIGTGCGAIAVSLALALPRARIYATDISPLALKVAAANCRRYGVSGRVELLEGNLLEPLPRAVDLIVANLPYVKDSEFSDLSPEIREYEPTVALAGGGDGLGKIQEMLEQMRGKGGARLGKLPSYVLLEIGQGQCETVTSLVNACFPQADIELISDLGGIERVVKVGLRTEKSVLRE